MAELNFDDLAEGERFQGVLLETFKPSKGISRPRVRPIELLPRELKVDFPRDLRVDNPIGTRFRADVKVCQKHNSDGSMKGLPYLYADRNTICKDEYFRLNRIIKAILKPGSISDRAYEYVWDDQVDALQKLREEAYAAASDELEAKKTEATNRQRSIIIKNYALARSNGVCEGCESPAPFITRNGTPYLESHHMTPVSPNGADDPRNVAAICPNCHARVEYGEDGERYNEKIRSKVLEVEEALEEKYK